MGAVRYHVCNKTDHAGHINDSIDTTKTSTFGNALLKHMILSAIFKLQKLTGDSKIYSRSEALGLKYRNILRAFKRKSQIGKQMAHQQKRITANTIAKSSMKKLVGKININKVFLNCRTTKIGNYLSEIEYKNTLISN
jgi:hypothetical protein